MDLKNYLDPVVPIFLLVDPMVGEPLFAPGATTETDSQSLRESTWQRVVVPIPLAKHCSLAPHQRPYLVGFTGPDDPLLDVTLELAHGERSTALADGLEGAGMAAHRIGGWLQTSMHGEHLADSLGAIFRVNTCAYTKATYLRLADRRVLALLRHIVGDSRVSLQFGRIQSWSYLDVTGRLTSLRSAGEETQPLRLSHEEWLSMGQGELLNRTLAQWLGEAARLGDERPSQLPTDALYAQLQGALAGAQSVFQACSHRFTELADQSAWTALSLLRAELPLSADVRALMLQRGTSNNPPEPFRFLLHEVSRNLEAGISPLNENSLV